MTWGCSCPQCGADDCKAFGNCGGTYEPPDTGEFILRCFVLMVGALVVTVVVAAVLS